MRKSMKLFAVGILVTLLGACSSQRDITYRGDALAVLHGTVTMSGTGQPPPLGVLLWWINAVGGNNGSTPLNIPGLTSKVAVQGQFPSAFTIEVMTPPPDEALIPCQDASQITDGKPQSGHFGFAHIEAFPGGVIPTLLAWPYGEAFEFRVVYVDQDVTACDLLAEFALPVFSKGYHLLKRIGGPCPAANEYVPGSCAAFFEVPLMTPVDLPVQARPLAAPTFLTSPVVVNNGLTAGPNCATDSLPSDPSTGSPCRLFVSAGQPGLSNSCGSGMTEAKPLDYARLDWDDSMPQRSTVCEVPQVPPSAWVNGSCAQSPEVGWCYLSGPGPCAHGAVFFSPAAAPAPAHGEPNPVPFLYGQLICP